MRLPGMSIIVLLLATVLCAQQPSQIVGDYIEARSNHVYGCYCEWSGEGVTGGREATLGWHFTAGEYGGTRLAGVKVAAVIVGEHTLSKGAAPRKSILFFDTAASKAQRQAVESLLRERYRELLGEILNVHTVPIQFQREADRATMRVGELLNLTLRKAQLPDDALQGAILWYDPFVPLTESTLATTLNTKYQGRDFNQQWEVSEPTISGYYGRFQLAAR
jgi:hypothetical protein